MDSDLKQKLENIKLGTELRIEGNFGSIDETLEKGKLKSIDWNNGTLVLHNSISDRDTTVPLDKITSIDDGTKSKKGYDGFYIGVEANPSFDE